MTEERKMLDDYYEWDYVYDDADDDVIIINDNGNSIILEYEMTLSPKYKDSECMRVFYKGNYYYFG